MYIRLKEYQQRIKESRKNFVTPFDVAYKAFTDLGYTEKESSFFHESASEYIENMRNRCWQDYLPYEKQFTVDMLSLLIDKDHVKDMTPEEAITDFVTNYPDHIYQLSLSNTQSRRSRAGKEFEAIIELLLIGADVPADSQGSIGKQIFTSGGLGKLVDFVSPGVTQYMKNKRNTTLISAKTTLRERWQEVPEEVTRTGTSEMYLATLDDSITAETRKVLYEANVVIATTQNNKEHNYPDDSRIVTFEELIAIAAEAASKWKNTVYTNEEVISMKEYLDRQIAKHEKHPYVQKYYENRLNKITSEYPDSKTD